MKRSTLEQFVKCAILVHGSRYNYSKAVYAGARVPLEIVCPIHGSFWQKPHTHLCGSGCKSCFSPHPNIEAFLRRAHEVHKDFYDYSKVKYLGVNEKIEIICPIHGSFWQRANTHLGGAGCRECWKTKASTRRLFTKEQFLKQAFEVHGNLYDYSKVVYKGTRVPVEIVCPVHGSFWQKPHSHIHAKHGCPECGHNLRTWKENGTEFFITLATQLHDGKYDYSKSVYTGAKDKLCIICPTHGEFWQTPDSHIRKHHGCPKCYSPNFKLQHEVFSFVLSLCPDAVENDKCVLGGSRELDIYIPSQKLAIEFNGIFWHSERFCDKNKALRKYQECADVEIRLITIFEDEWRFKKEQVKGILRHYMNEHREKLQARKLKISGVNPSAASVFLERYHLQGSKSYTCAYGLYDSDSLVSLMTFSHRNGGGEWELTRYCSSKEIVGAFPRLLKAFQRNNEWDSIVTFADKRYFDGSVYRKYGFEMVQKLAPDYSILDGEVRRHKFNYRKDALQKRFLLTDEEISHKTEHQICLEHKLYRIYDCGKFKFTLQNSGVLNTGYASGSN